MIPEPSEDSGLDPGDRRGAFKKPPKAAGREVRGLVNHSLRHAFAVRFLEGGAAAMDLQGVLGHTDLSTTRIYARIVDSRTRESLMALDYKVPAYAGDGPEPTSAG